MKPSGILFAIKKFAVHDGPGIRTTVFLKGCPLRCWWCHNPEGYESGIQKIENESIGKEFTVTEIMREIEKDTVFYDESGGGVTFSGGEPLAQPDFLCTLLQNCREKGIHTAVDTSGHAPRECIDSVMPMVDLFLYDLKFIDSGLSVKYTGISNDTILSNCSYICKAQKQVIIRIPIIPGITDTGENLSQLSEYMVSLHSVKRIDLLAFHNTAQGKFGRLGFEYKLKEIIPPGNDYMHQVKDFFVKRGFTVKIGG